MSDNEVDVVRETSRSRVLGGREKENANKRKLEKGQNWGKEGV